MHIESCIPLLNYEIGLYRRDLAGNERHINALIITISSYKHVLHLSTRATYSFAYTTQLLSLGIPLSGAGLRVTTVLGYLFGESA